MPLTSIIAAQSRIDEPRADAMFGLFRRYYNNVRHDYFLSDLAEKDWVILLLDGPELVGFSTLQLIALRVNEVDQLFLFSGDTIVDPAHWRDSTLAGCFGHFMLRLLAEHPRTPLHWFLISKGYRTYRFLPVFFNEFYPACDRPMPTRAGELLRAVAVHKFGSAFDQTQGIVRLNGQKDRLKPALCVIPPGRLRDPHIRFFLERNPTYTQGDELACIAKITRENLNRYAWRVIDQAKVTWDE